MIYKYRVVIAVVLPILILIIIRSSGANNFKGDAKKWAEPSVRRSNIISTRQIGSLPGEKLIINLDKPDGSVNVISADVHNITPYNIISKDYLNTIRCHDGPVLLFSSDPAISSRIWMVISQLGCKNIYILTNDIDNERFKYKFRPDTITSPEL